MHRSKCLLLPLALLLTTGCSSLVVGKFESTPPGAKVYVNGNPVGDTPCEVSVDFAQYPRTRVVMILPGYRPWEQPPYNAASFNRTHAGTLVKLNRN